MNDERIDPRILRTRALLRQALLTLVPQKGFSSLTIQDITDQATLNRATFYLHYTDKNELLLDVFDDLIKQAIPLPVKDARDQNEVPRPIVAMFDHVAAYADFYRVILGEEGVPVFVARIRDYIENLVLQWILATQKIETGNLIDPGILVNFWAFAHIGVVTWWLDNDMPYTSEQMEQQLLIMTRIDPNHSGG